MNVIYNLFARSMSEDISLTLGNMMLCGRDNAGRDLAYKSLIKHQLNKNRTLVIFQDGVGAERLKQIKLLAHSHGKSAFDISFSSPDGKIDALSAFTDPDGKAEFVVKLLCCAADIGADLRSVAHRFFYYAADTFDKLVRHYTLADLAALTPDDLKAALDLCTLDSYEKSRRDRFLTDPTLRSAFFGIESYIVKLETLGILEILSGTRKCHDLFSLGSVSVISGLAIEDKVKRLILIKSLMYILNSCIEGLPARSTLSVILNNVDFMENETVMSLVECTRRFGCVVYPIIENITSYVEKNGNELVEGMRSFAVFNQGSDANATFWSSFFGTHDVRESNLLSYTVKKRHGLFGGIMRRGGTVESTKKKYDKKTTLQKVNKPMFLPEEFRKLSPTEAICYLREPLQRRKSRVE